MAKIINLHTKNEINPKKDQIPHPIPSIYLRISKEEMARKELSPQVQLNKCAKYATEKGFNHAYVFEDHETGSKDDRKQYQQMLQVIDQKQSNCIITSYMDRLGRTLSESFRLMEYFDKKQMIIHSASENFDSKTPEGQIQMAIIIIFAKYERDRLIQRTKDRLDYNFEELKRIHFPLPKHIYEPQRTHDPATGKNLITSYKISPKAKKLIRTIYTLYNKGHSLQKISQHIQKKYDKKIGTSTIHNYLKNPVFTGTIKRKNKTLKKKELKIISQKTWQKTQTILSKGGHRSKTTTNASHNQHTSDPN